MTSDELEDEIANAERLLRTHRKALQRLKEQAATFGSLHVPPHILAEIDHHEEQIRSLEARLNELRAEHNARGPDTRNPSPSPTPIAETKVYRVLGIPIFSVTITRIFGFLLIIGSFGLLYALPLDRGQKALVGIVISIVAVGGGWWLTAHTLPFKAFVTQQTIALVALAGILAFVVAFSALPSSIPSPTPPTIVPVATREEGRPLRTPTATPTNTPIPTATPVPCQSLTVLLSGANEVPPNSSTATGSGMIEIDTVANTLSYDITFSGLSVPETAAHIHGFASPGINAGVIHPLPTGSPKIGVFVYNEADETNILAGLTYINIHSTNFPGGEIRGQITGQPSPCATPIPTVTPSGTAACYEHRIPAPPVPIIIQVEDFTCGGERVAYHDDPVNPGESGNVGGVYRPEEAVDIDEGSGDIFVGWTKTGEWLKFRLEVQQAGQYDLAVRVASTNTSGAFQLALDGADISPVLAVPNTGGWLNWQLVPIGTVTLPAGNHILVLNIRSNEGNYDYIRITPRP